MDRKILNKAALGLLKALAGTALLAGCQGQSPFTPSTDPVKDYGSLYENTRPYTPPTAANRADPNYNAPTVSFIGLTQSQSHLKIGEPLKFIIRIDDPAGSQAVAPDLQSISYDADAASDKDNAVDVSKAVTCEKTGRYDAGHWLFDCSFDTSAIPDLKTDIGSGLVVNAGFAATAVSNQSKKTSLPASLFIPINFEKEAAASGTPSKKSGADK